MWPFRSAKPLAFALPQGVRVYAVGDIHGKAAHLEALLDALNDDAAAAPAGTRIVEVFLGDYVDRGEQSCAVIERLIQPPRAGHERICLRGNHEQALLDALHDVKALRGWMQYGGLSTLASYGVEVPHNVALNAAIQLQTAFNAALPAEHVRFLHEMPITYECGDYYFVHAGVNPLLSLRKQNAQDQLWIREPFLAHSKPFAKYIVHGHTPLAAAEVLPHRANLDVSDAAAPSLCALKLEGEARDVLTVSQQPSVSAQFNAKWG